MRSLKAFLPLITLLLIAGCGSVISTGVLKQLDRTVAISTVQAEPALYKGRKVLWGGVIISSENRVDSTLIEVLATPLTTRDLPAGAEQGSSGRFLVEAPGFLDTVIYSPEKGITVAGTVKGVTTKKIGQMSYPYPVIEPIEIHLLDKTDVSGYRDYYYPTYYPYYWPYYPYPGYPWYYPYHP